MPWMMPVSVGGIADDDEDGEADTGPRGVAYRAADKDASQSAIDITAADLTPRLTTLNVTDIVLVSMVRYDAIE